MKKQVDKSKLLTVGVIAFLCLIFAGGFIYGLNSVLAMEGSCPPVLNEPGLTPVPTSNREALDFLYHAVDVATQGKPKIESEDAFDIDKDSLTVAGSDALGQAAKFACDDVRALLENSFEAKTSDFFCGIDGVLVKPDITLDEVESFTCEYIKYVCPSCGEESEEPHDHCEACGGVYPYNEVYEDDYAITLKLKEEDNDIVEKCFRKRSAEDIRALTAQAVDGKMKISRTDVTYNELYVFFKVNRLTNELKELSYRKKMTVEADFGFIGDYAAVEGGTVSFDLEENNEVFLTWPSLKLSESVMTVEPGSEDNLLATLTCDDATKYNVTWISSDSSVVAVDDEGYFKAGKAKEAEGKSAVITAAFTFGGKTYSDSCEVFVRVPVESVVLSKRKLDMKAGDSLSLSVKFSPSKATVQTVKWYTENESIVTVDENGTVKAVAPGTATIYILSDDGYFKSSCEVTVK
ncbi:MAG TPA: hypothetical protein DDY98_09365 [Ruminococcaceae bacterium]|nr:hypothetical protein [Oscillospiraceae bacterium]